MNRRSITMVAVFVLVIAALVVGGVAMAKRPGPVPGGCPWSGMSCPDIYDPVTCSNGVTYPNGCYAFIACATGCEGGGANQ